MPDPNSTSAPMRGNKRWYIHASLAMFAFPIGLLGYHALGAAGLTPAEPPGEGALSDAMSALGLGSGYSLRDLTVLERDLYYVEQRYVERARIDPEQMFQAALDRVERDFNEVMLTREPNGQRLHVSVSSYSTTLTVEPMVSVRAMSRELRRVAAILDEHLGPEVDRADVEYAIINGVLSTLDPHTLLLPPAAAKEMEIDNQGEFGGLGIELESRTGVLTIRQPIDGTPAAKAGLQSGDQIIRIEDESTINMDVSDAVTRLRGQIGAPVTISIKRKGTPEPFPVTIIRDRIRLNPVTSELLDGDVGYVRIKSFNSNVSADLELQLAALHRKSRSGLKGLVLDLRGNPGGYLTQAVEVSDRFLSAGVLVATVEGAGGRREEQVAHTAGTEPAYPMAVLVNGSSASASEIVAGALRNLDRAVIIGERTFGKGSVQHIYENKDESSLKLTVARYLTPGDQNIQNTGVSPDIQLEPSVVRAEEDGATAISLYWREWIEREGDLDHVLKNAELELAKPTYRLRYLRRPTEESGPTPVKSDWEVSFAADLLRSAGKATRVETLIAAQPTVERVRAAEQAQLERAFLDLGINWSGAANPATPAVSMTLDVGADAAIVAGIPEEISVEVANLGEVPLSQLSVITTSANPWLNEREFYVGRLEPGERRRVQQKVSLHEGYGAEMTQVSLTLRDPNQAVLAQTSEVVETRGQELPAFAYTVRLIDDGREGSVGNGNGLPDVGETVVLEVEAENTGRGDSADGWVRLRNRSGRAIDIQRGTAALGAPQAEDGAPCAPEADAACGHVLEAGARAKAHLRLELRSLPAEGESWGLTLSVGDNQRYDQTAVSKSGFYDYFQLEEPLELRAGQAIDVARRAPPAVELTRAPSLRVEGATAVVSGVVTDDENVHDMMIFVGQEKVFYRSGRGGSSAIPFTVEPELKPGLNHVVVLARDERGLRSTRSLSVWRSEGGDL